MSEADRLALLTPDTRERVVATLEALRAEGYDVRATSTLRTCDEQYKINASGVSPAIGCRSWHVWGRAADCFFFDNGKLVGNGDDPRYFRLGEVAKANGLQWGGDFKSNGPVERHHLQYPGGHTLDELCPDGARCKELVEGAPPAPDPLTGEPPSPEGVEPVKESEGEQWPEPGFSFWTVLLTSAAAAVVTGYAVDAWASKEKKRR